MNPTNPFSLLSDRFPGGCWPTPSQTLLLRAALLEPAPALSAWEEWNHRDDFEAVDSGSFRLLGLVYRNLARAGTSHPLIPRLHGVYRRFWTANQLILGRNAKLLSTFAEAGIPTMLTKGAALLVSAYRDYGTRPMDDLDLMVPHTHAVRAMELLEAQGWESEFLNARELPESLHACHFRHDGLGLIDLHWQLFHVATPDDLKSLVWRDAVSCSLNGHDTLTPNFSDQFLHACEHGVRYNIVPPFRWLADCFF
ncbi:MAG: nucleotidyltransferase family protein, partial [Verrucomicrobiales bacterium]